MRGGNSLRDLTVISAALVIVEQRLCEPMNAADLAKACFFSYSGLQKQFGYVLGCSVSEYITKRRLSKASKDLVSSDKSITDIAFEYQYDSSEAFTRAFKRFWGITPSEFRKKRRFSELHPKFKLEREYKGTTLMKRKPLDISELYDTLKTLKGTYTFGIDIVNFMQINKDYGYAAGDIVIAESFARIENELTNDMLLFRTGGDEFAVVTTYTDVTDAEKLARQITSHNGAKIRVNEHEIPLSLRVGISKMPDKTLSYQKALSVLENAVNEARKTTDGVAVYLEEG